MKTNAWTPWGLAALLLVTAGLARADEGMWLLEKPPAKVLKDRYGFEATPAWLEHMRKSCVRFSTGGSGSFVSADGLVMTNHHVGSDDLAKFSTADHDLLETGFLAKTRAEELPCKDLELMVLWSTEDVTDRIAAAVKAGLPPAEAEAARRKAMTAIEQGAEAETHLDCQVEALYEGARYRLYRYKRYTDVRLVMAPEAKVAFFGGDNDNFEYPRFDLDICFFRVYEDGKPLHPEQHLTWSPAGAKDGDLTFVCGHPGDTQRMYTADHLRYMRDVETPARLARLMQREVELQTFSGRSAENERIAKEDYLGVQNSRKAVVGLMAGLLDPAILRGKEADEALLAQGSADMGHAGPALVAGRDLVRTSLTARRAMFERHALLDGWYHALRSDLFGIARHLVRLADEKPKPNADRLRDYRESEMDSVLLELLSPAPVYDDLEINRLECGLTHLASNLGVDDPFVKQALGGLSPHARAVGLVHGTALKDVAVRKALLDGGKAAVAASKDPMIRLAADVDPEARAVRKKWEDEVESVEREGYAMIAAARFARDGEDAYPDANFTLRLAFGPIKGYEEDGRHVPAFTTLGGAFQRMDERKGVEPFALTKRWLDRKATLALDTPMNFVCTADIIGGNSGSPVVDRAGELIGIVFDGNIQSLVLDVAYTEAQARCVCVDSRAIVECLRKLYDARDLADEITKR